MKAISKWLAITAFVLGLIAFAVVLARGHDPVLAFLLFSSSALAIVSWRLSDR